MHLTSEVALDLIDGRMGKDQEIFWQQHLEVCNECTEDVGRWRQLGADLKRSHLQSASEDELKGVIQIFPHRQHEAPNPRSAIAALIFDSFLDPAFAGARGASAVARQLIMRAEEFDIHIKIWGEHDHRQMLGQLLPRGANEFARVARFHLLRNGEKLDSVSVDETGEFYFMDVPEGDLSLQIDLPNLTVIGALNVKQEQ